MQLEIALREGPVALRPLKAEDASLLLRWLTDPAVLEWYEGRDRPFTPQMVQEHFYKEDGLPAASSSMREARLGMCRFTRWTRGKSRRMAARRPSLRPLPWISSWAKQPAGGNALAGPSFPCFSNILPLPKMPRLSMWIPIRIIRGPSAATRHAVSGR